MLEKINILFLLYIIWFIHSQNINYEEACKNIYYSSKKDCTVAPWNENRRCCYISYDENGVRNGECVYLNDTKKFLKATKSEYEQSGKSKVKIECDSFYLKIISNYIIILCLLLF